MSLSFNKNKSEDTNDAAGDEAQITEGTRDVWLPLLVDRRGPTGGGNDEEGKGF